MFITIVNTTSVFKFDKSHFAYLVHSLQESNITLGYISKNGETYFNTDYNEYLLEKRALYIKKIFDESKGNKRTDSGSYKIFDEVHPDRLHELEFRYLKKDDYEENWVYIEEEDKELLNVVLKEEDSLYTGLEFIDDRYENVNRQYYREDLVLEDSRRFTLLPIIIKINNEYINVHIFMNIYRNGVGTINTFFELPESYFKQKPNDETPNFIQFDSMEIFEAENPYVKNNYWEKKIFSKDEATLNTMVEKYLKKIKTAFDIELEMLTSTPLIFFSHAKTELGAVSLNKPLKAKADEKTLELEQKNNKYFFMRELKNSKLEYVKRYSDEVIQNNFKQYEVRNVFGLRLWVSSSTAVLFLCSKDIEEDIIRNFKNGEDQRMIKNLDDRKDFQGFIYDSYKFHLYATSLEFAKIIETVIILREMLKYNITQAKEFKNTSIENYESLKEEYNELLIMQTPDLVFNNEGSPKENYIQISKNMNVLNLAESAEYLINQLPQVLQRKRDVETKNTEKRIISITTILTVIFGFSGIDSIVSSVGEASSLKIFEENSKPFSLTVWLLMVWELVIYITDYKKIKNLSIIKNFKKLFQR